MVSISNPKNVILVVGPTVLLVAKGTSQFIAYGNKSVHQNLTIVCPSRTCEEEIIEVVIKGF